MVARTRRLILTRTQGLALCLMFIVLTCCAAGAQVALEPTRLIDSPTAGLIDKGQFHRRSAILSRWWSADAIHRRRHATTEHRPVLRRGQHYR